MAIACTPNRRRTPDDTLVIAIEAAMSTADPRYAISNWDGKLSKLVHPGLTAVDTTTLEPRLELASKITAVDPRTWDVEVRSDAKFSDGAPVTAADVAYTYQSMLDPKSDSLFRKGFTERFSHVEPINARVVRFHLREPLATFQTDIDIGIISAAGKGAGPYVVNELTTTHVVLDASPTYFGTPPRVQHVEIKFVRDASARLLMLVGGSADLIQNGVRLDLLDDVRERPRVHLDTSPSVFLTYLMMNNADPLLKDVRVRQAIALAIDRPGVIAAKFGGRAVLATGLLPPGHWAYNGNVDRWNRDLPRAKALLDAAGYRDPDGPGPGMRMKLSYKTSSDAFRVSVARVIAAQLAEVGIDVELKPFEFATFFSDVKKGIYQLASMQTSEITEPDFYFMYFNSARIPTKTDPDGGNRWRYVSSEVDRLTVAGRRELDRAKRVQIYADVQRHVAADVPIVPLWHEDNVVLTNVDVQGYTISPNARLAGLATAWKQP
ncbi:MAG: ABC transporter substrate-binding protein [Deltaproteobacteria bacterium]|nr:ABC transporter substrate-binding protein [Deltaproteobacteria bacterium]